MNKKVISFNIAKITKVLTTIQERKLFVPYSALKSLSEPADRYIPLFSNSIDLINYQKMNPQSVLGFRFTHVPDETDHTFDIISRLSDILLIPFSKKITYQLNKTISINQNIILCVEFTKNNEWVDCDKLFIELLNKGIFILFKSETPDEYGAFKKRYPKCLIMCETIFDSKTIHNIFNKYFAIILKENPSDIIKAIRVFNQLSIERLIKRFSDYFD